MTTTIIKWALAALFLGSIAFVHRRGRVRLRFWRQLVDHSAFIAPVNVVMYAFSRVPAAPFLDLADFPELAPLQANWRTIRDEALALARAREIKAALHDDDAGFNSFFKYGWKRFYLKWYGEDPGSATRRCPRTVELLRGIPSVKAALFAELPPGGRLNLHRDPYAGSLRYHLGLVTANDARCWIEVDGRRYHWRDGEAVLFDETYLHEARNDSDVHRLILFCDVERPLKTRAARSFNRWFARHVMSAAASPNEAGDRTGAINRLFFVVGWLGRQRFRFKRFSPRLYHATRIALAALLLGWLVFG
jgi:beta-hydroxylase